MAGEWQPIETAPKDGTLVLLWAHDLGDDNDRVTIGSWEKYLGAVVCGGEVWAGWSSIESETEGHEEDGYWSVPIRVMPSHWMTLPHPPTCARSAGEAP